MIPAVLGQLRARLGAWIGCGAVAAAAGFALALAMCAGALAGRSGGLQASLLSSLCGTMVAFTVVAALGVVAPVAALCVRADAQAYARWAVLGATPVLIAWVARAQLISMALLGGAVGVAAAVPTVGPFFDYAFSSLTQEVGPLSVGFDAVALWAPAVVVVLVLVGGFRASRVAARTSPLEVLHQVHAVAAPMQWWRWVLLSAALAGLWVLGTQLAGLVPSTALSVSLFVSPLVLVAIVIVSPLLYPWVMRGWTALIPARVSPAWFLARHAAGGQLRRSTATITPLLTGVALTGGLYTSAAVLNEWMAQRGMPAGVLRSNEMLLILGGPLLLSVVGVTAVIWMQAAGEARAQDLAQAAGAGRGLVVRQAGWQALVHVVTTALLAGLVLWLTAFMAVTCLRIGSGLVLPVVIDPGLGLPVWLIGAVLTVLALGVPAAVRTAGSLSARLR